MICPCRDCTTREIGCHGNCEEYADWKKDRETGKTKWAETPEFSKWMKKYTWKKQRYGR